MDAIIKIKVRQCSFDFLFCFNNGCFEIDKIKAKNVGRKIRELNLCYVA